MCSGWVYSNSHTRGDWLGNQLVGEDETVDANGQRKGTGKSSRATNLTMRTRIPPQFAKKAPDSRQPNRDESQDWPEPLDKAGAERRRLKLMLSKANFFFVIEFDFA